MDGWEDMIVDSSLLSSLRPVAVSTKLADNGLLLLLRHFMARMLYHLKLLESGRKSAKLT